MAKKRSPELVERAVAMTPAYWRLVWIALDQHLAQETDLEPLERERLELAQLRIGEVIPRS